MVIATIIAQKHNQPDSTVYPELGGRDSMQYICTKGENSTHFEVKASMQQVLKWWELAPYTYTSMGGGMRAIISIHTDLLAQSYAWYGWKMFDSNGWTQMCDTDSCEGRIANYYDSTGPHAEIILTDEAYVCAKWAEREIRAITGMQCQIDPITPQ